MSELSALFNTLRCCLVDYTFFKLADDSAVFLFELLDEQNRECLFFYDLDAMWVLKLELEEMLK